MFCGLHIVSETNRRELLLKLSAREAAYGRAVTQTSSDSRLDLARVRAKSGPEQGQGHILEEEGTPCSNTHNM